MGVQIKDGEERAIPLPDSLVGLLRDRREQQPEDRLIFPTRRGQPDGHLLRHLKSTAHRGGLSCGQCVTNTGLSCSKYRTCKTWELHPLRKSFATLHHESGVSARTLMRWLGHSDLTTTLTYLEAADAKSERVRAMVSETFVGF